MSLNERLPCSARRLTHVWAVHVSTISNVTRATNLAHSLTLLNISVSHKVEAHRRLKDISVPHTNGDACTFARKQDRAC